MKTEDKTSQKQTTIKRKSRSLKHAERNYLFTRKKTHKQTNSNNNKTEEKNNNKQTSKNMNEYNASN